MNSKNTTKSLAKRFIELAGILFSLLLVIVAIAYAATFTTWAPGEAPQTAPGLGNAELTSGAVDTNTNAITECLGGQFLQGDGSCLTAAEIVAAAGSPPAPGDMYNCEELQKIGSDPDYPIDDDYRLTMDVDCSMTNPNSGNFDPSGTWSDGKGFDPIGDKENWNTKFSGTFDGQGYVISDLFINRPSEGYVGLFGLIDTNSSVPNIQNVGLENVDITGYDWGVGGLIGVLEDGGVHNSYVTGEVEAIDYGAGGLIGTLNGSSTITDSHADVDVAANLAAGGFIGNINSNSNEIKNSYSTGNVSGGRVGIGGFIGTCVGGNGNEFTNTYSTGDVSGNKDVGGYIGSIYGGGGFEPRIYNAYATGRVSGNSYVGGFAGVVWSWVTRTSAGADIRNAYWDTQKSGQSGSYGGTGLTTAQMQQQTNFSGWDFTDTWQIDEGNSYPCFKYMGSASSSCPRP